MTNEGKSINVTVTTSTILRVILFIALGFLLFKIKDILFLLLVSIVIASFIDAVADKLKKYKIPRTLTVITVFVLLILIFAAIVYAVVPTLFSQITAAINNLAKYVPQDKLQAIIDPNLVKNIDSFVNFFEISGV